MPVVLAGWNDFYDRWLAGFFDGGPPPDGCSPAYLVGRDTAAACEWNALLKDTLERERDLGHVVVTFLAPTVDVEATALAALRTPEPPARRRRRKTDDEIEARLKAELVAAFDAYVEHVRES